MSPGTRSASATTLQLGLLGVESFLSSIHYYAALAADSKVGGDGCLQLELEDGHATAILLPKVNQYRDKDHDDQNGESSLNI
ncbi:hypothetical protein E4U32_006960 [Claviceps aff. humidiphila group G2b]|nr:hypothetical protein E4U32_006960 [Claviceps aff. humidiphila group G2b]